MVVSPFGQRAPAAKESETAATKAKIVAVIAGLAE